MPVWAPEEDNQNMHEPGRRIISLETGHNDWPGIAPH